MIEEYDAIVVGVGAMGSATVYRLATRGVRVLGIERFTLPNSMGSSHGKTRIVRRAYYEHDDYVPLVERAYVLWRELERESGADLLRVTGSLDVGIPGSPVFEGSLRSCLRHGIPHEVMSSIEVNRRFPAYRLAENMAAVWQPDGGLLFPEECTSAHAQLALRHGGQIHVNEQVLGWRTTGAKLSVYTDARTYLAHNVVLCPGAWAPKLVTKLDRALVAERQVVAWFEPQEPLLFAHHRFPVFNLAAGLDRYYGLPSVRGQGMKIGRYHHRRELVDADTVQRNVDKEDEEVLREFVTRFFPKALGPVREAQVCLFTNSPDEHFVIDRVPGEEQVWIAGGFSGHGFKFASVVGEIIAELVCDGRTQHQIGLFRASRLTKSRFAPRGAGDDTDD